ncbi:unnamed protein product, partial [Musa acuminata var. zebrina]
VGVSDGSRRLYRGEGYRHRQPARWSHLPRETRRCSPLPPLYRRPPPIQIHRFVRCRPCYLLADDRSASSARTTASARRSLDSSRPAPLVSDTARTAFLSPSTFSAPSSGTRTAWSSPFSVAAPASSPPTLTRCSAATWTSSVGTLMSTCPPLFTRPPSSSSSPTH